MTIYLNFLKWLFGVGAAAFAIGIIIHEGSHWITGWMGNTGPKFEVKIRELHLGVSHRKIEVIDPQLIRASGFAPLVWIPVLFVSTGWFVTDVNTISTVTFVALIVNFIMLTESDRTAISNPEEYRQQEIEGNPSSKSLIVIFLKETLSRESEDLDSKPPDPEGHKAGR
ncbi:hypothetical protein ACKVMT_13950 [Halobacteriales archaeon Cl-PHB]